MAERDRGSKRKKPPGGLSDLLAKAKRLLAEDNSGSVGGLASPFSSSSSSSKKRSNKADTTYRFFKDSTTGRRITHTEYRPRSGSGHTQEPEDEEIHDCDITAENFPDDDMLSCFEEQEFPSMTPSGATSDLACALEAANNLLEEWRANRTPSNQNWGQRISNLNESWAGARQNLFNSVLSTFGVHPEWNMCSKCLKNPAVIRCYDCHMHIQLCGACDQSVHEIQPFHDRSAFKCGFLKPIPPTVSVDHDGEWVSVDRYLPFSEMCLTCPFCNTCNMQRVGKHSSCVVVNLRGRFDVSHVLLRCLHCNKDVPTSNPLILAQLGFWPGSVSSLTYVCDPSLFLHWDLFQKESPGSSERSFLKSLEQFSSRKGRVGTINSKTFAIAFKEWKFCQYELDVLRKMDWMECPSCKDIQHSVHVDGNMKLYRFKSAGLRQRDCYYGDVFIASNKQVDTHIQKLYQGAKPSMNSAEQNKCGDTTWRAAGNSLRKKTNLCETGLEIAGCRHSMAQKAVNMMYGEIYGYAHYLQKTYFIPKKVKYFWYDVVCKYWPWLKKNDGEVSEKMKPALSIMHAKAHSWSCQAIWGGRWQDGASATTGEEVEQINSHFSRLGTITKHMLPEGREELLTEHALQWNRKKVVQLPQALAKRYSRTKNQLTNARKALLEHLKMLQVTTDVLTGWKKDIHHAAQEEQNSQNSRKMIFTPKEEEFLAKLLKSDKDTVLPKHAVMCEVAKQLNGQQYKQLLSRCKSAGNPAALGVADVEPSGDGEKSLFDKVTAHLTKQMENFYFSISQIVYNMGKLGDSSKQRQRLRRKVSQEKDCLKEALNRYNKLVSDDRKAKQEDIEKGEFPWQLFHDQLIGNVPISTKKAVVNKKMEVERFQEELVVLRKEMMSFMSFYKDSILPSILEDKRQLQASLLTDNEEPESSDLEQDKVVCQESDNSSIKKLPRYATLTPTQSAKRGLLSLLEEGKDFALKQIATGVNAFASVLSDELDAFRKLSLQSEEDGLIDPFDDTQKEECEEEDEEEEEYEEDDERELQLEALGNGDLAEFAKILNELDELAPLCSVSLGEEVCVWKFPQKMCQSLFNQRNGSNACSLISLLTAYVLEKKNIQIPDEGFIPSYLVKILCGCIELGNRIYDNCRDSLPNRYLSIQEAFTLLPFASISVENPLPVRLEDEHHLSTIWGQLDSLKGTSRNFVNVIIDEKTSLFVLIPPSVLYIDTHSHSPHGAVIVKGPASNLRTFCRCVWELEGHADATYGNICALKFP